MADPIPPRLVTFDSGTVSLDALQRSAYALAGLMSVDIRKTDSEYVCSLFPNPGTDEVSVLANRLRREVIDQMLRERIREETGPIRDLIFALAFSRTGLIPEEEPPS